VSRPSAVRTDCLATAGVMPPQQESCIIAFLTSMLNQGLDITMRAATCSARNGCGAPFETSRVSVLPRRAWVLPLGDAQEWDMTVPGWWALLTSV
jgi:hypothetical protein